MLLAAVAAEGQTPPGRLTLSTARDRVSEGEGSFTVTATLDRPAPAGGVGVTLSAAAESTATNADYTLPGALRIAAGRRSAGATVTIAGDRIDEEDETIVLSATTTAAGVTVAGATVTIVDDDDAGVRVDPTTVAVDERQHQRARHGATARYAVALTSEPTHPVTVTPVSGDPGAARVAPATLTFNARTWQTAQTVAVTGVRDADLIDETVTITHRVTSSDARYASLTPASLTPATVTASVVDADGGGTFRVAFGRDGQDTAWTATVAEGDGTLVIPVTTGFQAFERVSFEVEAVAAETTAGAGDYRLGATSVTFGPTDVSRTRSLTIAIADDALVESTETVTLRFTGLGEGQLLLFSRYGPAATVTITDDDAAAARIAFGDDAQAGAAWNGSVTEGGGTLAVPVTVSHLPSAPTTFPVTLAAGTSTGISDFELGSVTFGPATARTRTLTVTATDDALVESAETLALRIAPPANPARGLGDHYARGGAGATVTLVDNDAAAARIAFGNDAQATAAYAATVAEGAGTLTVPVTVSHLPDEATTFSVTIDQDATTAQFLRDYAFTWSMTFGPTSPTTQPLSIVIGDDADYEGAETIALRIAAPAAPFDLGDHYARDAAGATAAVTIIDDDVPAGARIAFGRDAQATGAYVASVAERDGEVLLRVPVTVSHLPPVAATFAVEVVAEKSTAQHLRDYVHDAAVTFGPADRSPTKHVEVVIRGDELVEQPETIALRIAAADATPDDVGDRYARDVAGATATVTITDDDAAAAWIAFGNDALAATPYTVRVTEEDRTLALPVTVSHLPDAATTFAVEVVAGGTSAGSGDYRLGATVVTFGPESAKTRNLTVTVADDALVEGAETIALRIAASPADGLGRRYSRTAGASATVTIADDDRAVAFGDDATAATAWAATVAEEDGGVLTVPVTVSHLPDAATTFAVEVIAGRTSAGSGEYRLGASSVTFGPATAATRTLTVHVVDDALFEGAETIALRIAASPADDPGAGYARHPAGATATVTIADDEAKVARAAFGDDAQATAAWTGSVVEGQTLTVPITVSHLPGSPLTIAVVAHTPFTIDPHHVTGDLIFGIRDFTVVGRATFRPTDRSRTKTIVTATATDDDVAEPSEYITLYIGRTSPYRQGPAATITVIDNDGVVAKPVLVVTPTTLTRVYGEPEPRAFAYTVAPQTGSSFVHGDDAGSEFFTLSPLIRTPGDDAGEYAFALADEPYYGRGMAAKYDFVIAPGAAYTITPKALTIAAPVLTRQYDGTTGFGATVLAAGGEVSGAVGADRLTLTPTGGSYPRSAVGAGLTIDAPTFTLTAAGAARVANYRFTLPTAATGSITQRQVTYTATDVDKEYDSSVAVLADDLGGSFAAGDVIVRSVSTNVGTVRVSDEVRASGGTYAQADVGAGIAITGLTLTGADAGNYAATFDVSGAITPRQVTVSTPVTLTRAYDGTTAAAGAGIAGGGAVSGEVDTESFTLQVTGGSYPQSDVGAGLTIVAPAFALRGGDAASKPANYRFTAPATATGAITRARVTAVTGVTVIPRTVDGSTAISFDTSRARAAAVVAGELADFRAGGLQVSGAYPTAVVGTHDVTVSYALATHGSFKATNYELAAGARSATLRGKITAVTRSADAALSGLTLTDAADDAVALTPAFAAATYTYAAEVAAATQVKVTPAVRHANADVTVAGETVAGGAAGTVDLDYGANAVAVVVTAEDGTTTRTYALTVTRKGHPLRIRVLTPRREYGGSDDLRFVAQYFRPGDAQTAVLSGAVTRAPGEDAGRYAFDISGLTLQAGYERTYELVGVTPSHYTITPKPVTAAPVVLTKAYDGSTDRAGAAPSGGAVSGAVAGESLTVQVSGGVFADPNAGAGIAVSGHAVTLEAGAATTAANYRLARPVAVSGTITKKPVTYAAAAADKEYDGTTAAPARLGGSFASGDVVVRRTEERGDGGTVIMNVRDRVQVVGGSYAAADVGAGIAITGLTLSGEHAGNYAATFDVSGAITPRPVTIAAPVTLTRAYDGTTAAAGAGIAGGGTVSGAVSGQRFTLQVTGGSYPRREVGSSLAIGAPTFALRGVDAASKPANYRFTPPVAVSGAITKKAVTFSGAAATRVYDGSAAVSTVLLGAFAPPLIDGDAVTLSGGTYDSADAGTARKVSAATVGGAQAGNYELALGRVTGTILRRPISAVGGVTVARKIADGTTTVRFDTSAATGAGVVSAELADFRAGGLQVSGAYPTAAVGTHDVTVSYALATHGSFKATNYELAAGARSATLAGGIVANSGDATLRALSLSAGTVSPAFAAARTGYVLRVANRVTATTVTATPSDGNATLRVGRTGALARVTGGAPSAAIALDEGDTVIKVEVTAVDGTTRTYTVTVTRWIVQALVLTPTTSGRVYGEREPAQFAYTVAPKSGNAFAPGDDASTTFFRSSPLTRAPGDDAGAYAVRLVSSPDYAPGMAAKYTFELAAGATYTISRRPLTISGPVVLSKAYDGTTSAAGAGFGSGGVVSGAASGERFTLAVTGWSYPQSDVGAGLTIASPTFTLTPGNEASRTSNYSYTLPSAATGVIEARAITEIGGVTVADKPIDGSTDATFDTSAATGAGVVAAELADFRGGGLRVSGAFPAATAGTHTLAVTYALADRGSFKKGNYTLDGAAASGSLTGRILPSNDATLSALSISTGTLDPVFKTTVTAYAVGVTGSVTSVTLTPTVNERHATVTVNGAAVSSGQASGAVALDVGSNAIKVEVTAQDGTKKTYTVTVTRAAASSDATLSALWAAGSMDGSTYVMMLSPAFAASTLTYAATVPNAVTHVKLSPEVNFWSATVKVGKPGSLKAVRSGVFSGGIALDVGSNAIKVEVTAEDTTTSKTYTVTVTRAAAISITAVVPGDRQLTLTIARAAGVNTGAIRWREKDRDPVTSGDQPGPWFPGDSGFGVAGTATTYVLEGSAIHPLVNGRTYEVQVRGWRPGPVRTAWSASAEGTPTAGGAPPTTPQVGFESGAYRGKEGGSVTVGVSIAPQLPQASTVTLGVHASTMDPGEYVIPARVTLPANTGRATFTVSFHDDVHEELTEDLVLTLTAIPGAPYAVNAGLTVVGAVDDDLAPPSNLVVTAGNAKLDLSWTATLTSHLDGYAVQHKESGAADRAATTANDPSTGWVETDLAKTATTHALTGLANGTAYDVRVRAKNSAGKTSVWITGSGTPALLSALTAAGSTDGSDFSTTVTLSPAFATATLTYTATVARGVTHVKLTPTVTESSATVKVGKTGSLTAVRSGEASGAIALDVGANEIKVEVTRQDGTTKTYTVTVTRKMQERVLVLSPTATGREYGQTDPAQWEYTVAAKSGSTFATGHDASTTFFTSNPLTRDAGNDVGQYTFKLVSSPQYATGMEALYAFEVAAGAKYTITKKALSISTPVVLTKAYDGGAAASGASVKSGGAVTGEVGAESFALTVSGGTYPQSAVGAGLTISSPTFTLSASGGAKTGNYQYTLPDAATGEITAAEITDIDGVTVVSRLVDGTTDATFDTTAATGAGVVSGEEAGFRAGLTVSGRFPDGAKTTANTYDVAVTYALGDSGGFDASNYTLGDSGDTLRGTVTAYATWEHLNFRVVAGDRQVTVSWDQPAGAEQIFIRWTATPGVWQSRLMSRGGLLNCITTDFPNGYRVAATAGSYVITKTYGPPINVGEATGTALENDTQVTVQVGEGPGCFPRRRAGSDREGTWKLFRVTPASTDARLSALTAAGSTDGSDFSTTVTLSPAFAASTLTYTATVARGVTHVKLTPTVTESSATVKVGKTGSLTAVRSGEASDAIALDVGANEIKVEVTQDGTTKTYTVTVTRKKPVLVLSPTATGREYGQTDPAQWEYTVAAKSGSAFASGHDASTTFFTSSPLTRDAGNDVGQYTFKLVGSPQYATGMEALYAFEVASGAKYTITKKALTIGGSVVLTKAYDGGAAASGASVKSGGAVSGEAGEESFALAVSGGTYPQSDVGTG